MSREKKIGQIYASAPAPRKPIAVVKKPVAKASPVKKAPKLTRAERAVAGEGVGFRKKKYI